MSIEILSPPAKILHFSRPARNDHARIMTDIKTKDAPPASSKIVHGHAWYHDVAIEEERVAKA